MEGEILHFNSHGKFLLTGEYLILKGAVGLALPLQFGQSMNVHYQHSNTIEWESYEMEQLWFQCKLELPSLKIIESNNTSVAETLQKILLEVKNSNSALFKNGCQVKVKASFNLSWGLGSSSTLINNIAQWAQVDPYDLLKKTFGGSGYDIACASAEGPITFQLDNGNTLVNRVNFFPSFHDQLFFVYLGKKMNSRTGMKQFNESAQYGSSEIAEINSMGDKLLHCQNLDEFQNILNRHEQLMSEVLGTPTIKEQMFADYPGTIKSLGAWGGDFVLVTGESLQEVTDYFTTKNLTTIFPYKSIILGT